MKEEDEETGDMCLSDMNVPRVARNAMKMWKARKEILKLGN